MTYHFRLKAVGSCQTTYDEDLTFTTLSAGESDIIFNPDLTYDSVKDIDGNTYKTIQIGAQIWMAENLRTITFNDNNPVTARQGDWSSINSTAPVYSFNDYLPMYKNIVGAVYNWYAVNTNKLCPTGWHVPTDVEWTILTNYLGGENVAGNKLIEAGVSHWWSSSGGTNESGFTALPGFHYSEGYSNHFDSGNYWWSSTQSGENYVWIRYISSNGIHRDADGFKRNGYSVRCIKDS